MNSNRNTIYQSSPRAGQTQKTSHVITPVKGQQLSRPTSVQAFQKPYFNSVNSTYQVAQDQDLGRGTFGAVKLVREVKTGKLFAMKIISKEKVKRFGAEVNIKQEIVLQSRLNHKNILKLYESFEDRYFIYIILEYCSKGNLYQMLRRKKGFTEDETFPIFYQLCQGLEYLHLQGIVHRDVKPENILFFEDDTVKICDFNWAKKLNPGQKCDPIICGTTEYMPPEVVSKLNHDFKVDLWSLGVILYEFLHGGLPFSGETQKEKISNIICNANFKINPDLSLDLQKLLHSLLSRITIQRPSFYQISKSGWTERMVKEIKYPVKQQKASTVYNKVRCSSSSQSHQIKSKPQSVFSNSNASQKTNTTLSSKQPAQAQYNSCDKMKVMNSTCDFKSIPKWDEMIHRTLQQISTTKTVQVKGASFNPLTVFGGGKSDTSGAPTPQTLRHTTYTKPPMYAALRVFRLAQQE